MLLLLLFVFKQKTPKFLYLHGKTIESEKSLGKIYKAKFVKQKIKEMIEDLKINKKSISLKDTLKFYKKPLFLTFLLAFAGICNGAMTFLLYSVNIFLDYVTLETATLLTNVLMLFNAVGTLAGFVILPKFGRKIIAIGSMSFSAFILASITLQSAVE